MERGIERLDDRLKELNNFDVGQITDTHPPGITALSVAVQGTLARIFGEDTSEYRRFETASKLQWEAGFAIGDYPQLEHYKEGIDKNIKHSIALLGEAKRSLYEDLDEVKRQSTFAPPVVTAPKSQSKVFVVHGRVEGPCEAVARFLERLGFQPIILHEQANQGRTVIEKIEAHSDVGFAVVILTPDDMGNLNGEPPQPRACQNVLLELGYFIGKLNRSRVCTLKVGDPEIPSDWRGVVDEPYDAGGGWKQTLARELEAAGYAVDWNRVMRQ